MKTDVVRAIHDAAIALGAHCDSNCYWNPSQYKSHTMTRAKAVMFLHDIGRDID